MSDQRYDDEVRREEGPEEPRRGLTRRSLLALAGTAAAAGSLPAAAGAIGTPAGGRRATPAGKAGPHEVLEAATIAELQEAMAVGALSAVELTQLYIDRIEALDDGPDGLASVLEVNPQALELARRRDRERAAGTVRGPLHGIPILLKDNIDTGDSQATTAGSLALVGAPAARDARAVWQLRRAGAVILGKTNLSEWANFRGFSSSSGWSAVGGQTGNPYALDRNPCGSSSGSAAATSASLAAAALGTETDGSVVCPASACGIVGIKPTIGLVSQAGVVPISHTQDTIGTHGKTVADAATLLGGIAGFDPASPVTARAIGRTFDDYTRFVDPDGLAGARIGVARQLFAGITAETAEIVERALEAMADAGAILVDPVSIPSFDEFAVDISEVIVLVYEFKRDLNAYLATRTGVPVETMADVIAFNDAHADEELRFYGQEWFILSEIEIFSEAEYREALERGSRLAGREGIDAAIAANGLDALVAPTNTPAWPTDLVNGDCFLFGSSSYAAVAGYPLVTVPAGDAFGLPVGVSFMAGAFSEPTLIRLASGFEAAVGARRTPELPPTLPIDDGPQTLRGARPAAAAAVPLAERAERLRERLLATPGVPRRVRYL